MLHIMYPATATALVGAGLITVMVFPALAFALIGEPSSGGPSETPELDIGLTTRLTSERHRSWAQPRFVKT